MYQFYNVKYFFEHFHVGNVHRKIIGITFRRSVVIKPEEGVKSFPPSVK